MKFIQYTLITCLLLSLSYASAQDITVGNTTLTEREVVVGVQVPWEIVWGPDDHIWATERRGKILRIEPQSGTTTEILDYTDEVDYGGGEPGMLGMCLHPDFENTPLVYVVYASQSGFSYSENLLSFEWNGTE